MSGGGIGLANAPVEEATKFCGSVVEQEQEQED